MSDKFQNKYRISSARLQNWDYGSNAAYFVTICTQNREHFFGEIMDDKMQLSEMGKITEKYWHEIPQHFPFVKLGAFVVMPNHVHGIIIIDKTNNERNDNDKRARGDERTVETLPATSLPPPPPTSPPPPTPPSSPMPPLPNQKNQQMASISPKRGSLSTIIRSYKSVVTKNARQIHADFAWQSRFHDHIIRNDESFLIISNYIINNPINWKGDKFNNKER